MRESVHLSTPLIISLGEFAEKVSLTRGKIVPNRRYLPSFMQFSRYFTWYFASGIP